jgi:V/A-type H+-transporting ATPase subunit E
MAEELQNLLERIQKDGVEKAETEAEKIISEADAKAKAMLADAEKNAKEILEKADQDAKAFDQRSKKSLEQSARDAVLTIGQALNKTLEGIVREKTSESISDNTLKKMLIEVVKSYFSDKKSDKKIEVLLNPEHQKDISKFLMSEFKGAMEKGLEIKGDDSIVSGFKVSLADEKIEHDFSDEAITEALCQLLRPRLAEIVKKAMSNKEAKSKE